MRDIRAPVVAGTFYPGSPEVLASTVDRLLREAAAAPDKPRLEPGSLHGLVVPHAGYVFSGPVAATAYALLAAHRLPSVAVILGPSHFEPLRGLAVAPHSAWSTPLGEVPIDERVRQALLEAGAGDPGAPHAGEHSIEVQLPFLQRASPDLAIVPVAVGVGSPWVQAEMLDRALPPETLLVVSTDLSHYQDAGTARRLDARTAQSIEELAIQRIDIADACGVDALRAALAWASLRGCRIVRLDLHNSADTVGDPSRVVGYGAFAIIDQPAGRA